MKKNLLSLGNLFPNSVGIKKTSYTELLSLSSLHIFKTVPGTLPNYVLFPSNKKIKLT